MYSILVSSYLQIYLFVYSLWCVIPSERPLTGWPRQNSLHLFIYIHFKYVHMCVCVHACVRYVIGYLHSAVLQMLKMLGAARKVCVSVITTHKHRLAVIIHPTGDTQLAVTTPAGSQWLCIYMCIKIDKKMYYSVLVLHEWKEKVRNVVYWRLSFCTLYS